MKHTHLTDDELIALCVAGTDPAPPDSLACHACDERRHQLTRVLRDVTHAATESADAAFPPAHLQRQHARILQRLKLQGHLGRVLAFPLAPSPRPSLLRPRPVRRWVASAAVAGLVVGMVAGHMAHRLPAFRELSVRPQATLSRAPLPIRPAVSPPSDDEFLREVERAVGSFGPAALRRIDAMTPVAWEVP